MVGVSCDSQADNKAFQEKFSFPYDLLCDADGSMSRAYGALTKDDQKYAARISYLIGPDGKVVKSYPKVSPADHPKEVLGDIP